MNPPLCWLGGFAPAVIGRIKGWWWSWDVEGLPYPPDIGVFFELLFRWFYAWFTMFEKVPITAG